MAASTAIGTLTIRGGQADTPALRLRAARELQAADLTPTAIAPSAVLVVRRLIDPLPGRFGGGHLRPPLEWERAVRRALDASARTAARPDERGRVPSSADAVLFADEAELVACLLADRARGDLAARWWWRSILPRLGLPAMAAEATGGVGALLRARPRDLPAALAHVVRWGEGPRVADAIGAADAAAALDALASAYALPRALVSASADGHAPLGLAPRNVSAPRVAGRAITDDTTSPESTGLVDAPWDEWLPAQISVACRHPEVQCLMGVTLALVAAPSRLRSPDVASRGRRWWRAVLRSPSTDHSIRVSTAEQPPATAFVADVPPRLLEAPSSAAVLEAPAGSATPASSTSSASSVREERTAIGEAVSTTTDATGTRPLDAHAPTERLPVVADLGAAIAPSLLGDARGVARLDPQTSSPAAIEPEREERVASVEPAFAADGVVTDLGGVFYLIHVLDALGIPDEAAQRFGVAGAWTALDLIARALVGPRFVSSARDPIWEVLARLAGRERSADRKFAGRAASKPGRRSDPPFIVPAARLDQLHDVRARFRWATAAGRVWIWSPHGYLVVHRRAGPTTTPRDVRDLAAAAGATRPVHVVRAGAAAIPWLPPARLPADCPMRAGRWAAVVAPAVGRRLQLAIGDGRFVDLVRSVFDVRARVFVTSSHVDVVVRLDAARLSLRRAGLDRDPGWLPAYGRVVYFHFE